MTFRPIHPTQVLWGTDVITQKYTAQTTSATQTTVATIALDNNVITDVNVIIKGKNAAAAEGFRCYINIAYMRHSGGGATAVGSSTPTTSDTRKTDETWSATIETSGNDILIKVTGEASTTIDWDVIVQIAK